MYNQSDAKIIDRDSLGKIKKGNIPHNKKQIEWHEDEKGCFVCISHKTNRAGYPLYAYNGKKYLLHRFIYEKTFGKFDSNLNVCHHCDNPTCINPSHLFLGTHLDNMRDMCKKGRHGNNGLFGERHPNSILKEKDILKIRELHSNGETQVSIAKKYKTTQANISLIVKCINWKYLKEAK